MKIVVLTSNAIRHRFVANTITQMADASLVVCEAKPSDAGAPAEKTAPDPVDEHFRLRFETEAAVFGGHTSFQSPVLPILYRELNLPHVVDVIRGFSPDFTVVFGSSIIREPLLSLLPRGRIINIHLGLSPYYRGAGTNFWPFVNDELQYVGATLLHLDAGVDTGNIISHVRPAFESSDDVHTTGCKVVEAAVHRAVEVVQRLAAGKSLPNVKQWTAEKSRYYRSRDFDRQALDRYLTNLNNGIVREYLANPAPAPRLIELA